MPPALAALSLALDTAVVIFPTGVVSGLLVFPQDANNAQTNASVIAFLTWLLLLGV
jgi:hypothetical protein